MHPSEAFQVNDDGQVSFIFVQPSRALLLSELNWPQKTRSLYPYYKWHKKEDVSHNSTPLFFSTSKATTHLGTSSDFFSSYHNTRKMGSMRMCLLLFVAYLFSGLMQLAHGEMMAPSPATNDGKEIDQRIAYILMLVALLVTYLIH